jgi:hypothetical protein
VFPLTASRPRSARALAPLLLAGALLLAGLPPAALATTFPSHRLGAVTCADGGVMKVSPPARMAPTAPTDFRNAEEVLWRPTLQRLSGGVWRHVASGPRFRAFTSSYGFFQTQFYGAWQNATTNTSLLFHPFGNLGPGTYRVKHYLWWSWHPSRLWHVHREGRCTFV